MKHIKTNLFSLLIILILIMSCEKEAVNEEESVVVIEETEEVVNSETTEETQDCGDFIIDNLIIEPFCNIDPRTNTTFNFPMAIRFNGEIMNYDDYEFLWSNGAMANMISAAYSDLPVSVTVTDKVTECSVLVTLDSSYWD